MSATCATCRFWKSTDIRSEPYPGTNGWCRRYAPQGPVIKPQEHGWQLFPPMNSVEWCGDHEPAPVLAKPQAMAAAA